MCCLGQKLECLISLSSFPRRELKCDYQRQQASLQGGLVPRPFFASQGKMVWWTGTVGLLFFVSATWVYFAIKLAQATENQVGHAIMALLHSHFQFPLDSNSWLKTKQLHFLNFMLTLPSHPNRCIHVLQRACDWILHCDWYVLYSSDKNRSMAVPDPFLQQIPTSERLWIQLES